MPFAPQISQFSDTSIPFDVAASLCGPAAAIAFARVNGRNPTLGEVKALAAEVGWTPGRGMAGPTSERALLRKMGIASDLTPAADPARVRADVQGGRPVIVSTGLHYFTLSDYDPSSDRFYVGTSGTDLKNGREWMSLDEIDRASRDRGYGGINGALHLSAPPAGATADRQRFLEANAPGESAPERSGGTTTSTSSVQQGEGARPREPGAPPPQENPGARVPDDPIVPELPGAVPAMGGRSISLGQVDPAAQQAAAAGGFAQQLLAQLGAAAAGGTTPYQLPPLELPGFRPTRFRLPGGMG